MFRTIAEFLEEWKQEQSATQKVLDALTDESLQQKVSPKDRSLGEIGWHLATSMRDILAQVGVAFDSPGGKSPVPASAREIADGYRKASAAMTAALKAQWTDATLQEVRSMYGMPWPNWYTLTILIKHEVHHRGQMTVLMRQAGLQVPDIYGPARKG